MGREYFKTFHSYIKSIEPLSDAERGRLFTAMLEYSITGEVPHLSGNEKYVFPTMQVNIDREISSYNDTVERNRENGKMGGRPPKRKNHSGFIDNPKNQSGFSKSQDKDKDKDYISPPIYPPHGGAARSDREVAPVRQMYSDAFETFWKAYPSFRAANKAKCAKVFGGIPKDQLPRVMESLEAHKRSKQWRDGIIPLALTWLNQRRWECSPPPPPKSNGRHAAAVGYEQRPVDESALQSLIINLDGGAE